jgi:hypothetical protein
MLLWGPSSARRWRIFPSAARGAWNDGGSIQGPGRLNLLPESVSPGSGDRNVGNVAQWENGWRDCPDLGPSSNEAPNCANNARTAVGVCSGKAVTVGSESAAFRRFM